MVELVVEVALVEVAEEALAVVKVVVGALAVVVEWILEV